MLIPLGMIAWKKTLARWLGVGPLESVVLTPAMIDIGPNDVAVLMFPDHLSMQQIEQIKGQWDDFYDRRKESPPKVMVLDGGGRIGVIRNIGRGAVPSYPMVRDGSAPAGDGRLIPPITGSGVTRS